MNNVSIAHRSTIYLLIAYQIMIQLLNIRVSLKKTTIGNDVWIGAGVVIIAGVTIGNGVVIGANSVVTKDIPDYSIYAGVPAKLLEKEMVSLTILLPKRSHGFNTGIDR